MVTDQLISIKNGIANIIEGDEILPYLLLLEQPSKVLVARVLIEPSSAAG